MNAKKLIALFVALLMLVVMFSACSTDAGSKSSGGDASDKSSGADKSSGSDASGDASKSEGDDAPDDATMYDFGWMGIGELDGTGNALVIRDILDGKTAVGNEFFEVAKQYGLNYDVTVVQNEIYVSTLNSLAASGELPNSFMTRGTLDDATIVNWIEQGLLLSCNATIAESSGNMQKFFGEEDGQMRWAYAWAQYTDGDWYTVAQANNTPFNIQITEADGPLRMVTQVHGAYSVMMRQNWLNDLGLDMPDSADKFYDAAVMMNEQDANGNGMADERIYCSLGDKQWQYQGIGQWFGLPIMDFIEDPSTGECEVGVLCDGFDDWATYLNKFYVKNVVQVGDGAHMWSFGTYLPENNVISWFCMQTNLQSSAKSLLGMETDYEPVPVFGVEGITPRVVVQEAAAASFCYSATAETDPKAFAAFNDFMYSQELYMLSYYGVEGESYEWNDDGSITSWGGRGENLNDDRGLPEDQYRALHEVSNWTGIAPIPQDGNCWGIRGGSYNGYDEALANDEPYFEFNQTVELWMSANEWYTGSPCRIYMESLAEYGEENINFAAYYSFPTLPTAEQSQILTSYGTDLKTYLTEIGTKLVTGEYSVDQIEELVQAAYDTYHLQEYMDVYQDCFGRFMEAIG